MPQYIAGWNQPDTEPETEPRTFGTVEDATAYLREDLEKIANEPGDGIPSETAMEARRVLTELDPDSQRAWWQGEAPFTSTDVGGYVYWIVEDLSDTGVREYLITLKHDKGTVNILTTGSSPRQAVRSLLKAEHAPLRAVRSVRSRPLGAPAAPYVDVAPEEWADA